MRSRHTAAPSLFGHSKEAVKQPNLISVVFVIDDDVSVRESLELLIKREGYHPELFASAREFLSHPTPATTCCLILDLNLPELNGLELQKQLIDRSDMPIVFISGDADVPASVQAMKAGAIEFLTKPLRHEVVVTVIRDAIERSREARQSDLELGLLRSGYESLTQREREVMALVVSGLLNKQIAGELDISEITVKKHRGQVMRKMKADSLPDLVTMAARLGLRPSAKH
jgi:FixJ family two-component response regulator